VTFLWTFRYFASSLPGRCATWSPGRFSPLDVSIPGRFASSLDVSPPVSKLVICDTVTTSANLYSLDGRYLETETS